MSADTTRPPGDWTRVEALPESHDITPKGLAAVGYVGEVLVEWKHGRGRPQRWATNSLQALHEMRRRHLSGNPAFTLYSWTLYPPKRTK